MFATISVEELQKLNKAGASASVMSVYLVIKSYAYGDKEWCFPSIASIKQRIGGGIIERTIYKAIKWLKEHEFISVGLPKTQKRFVIKSKQKQDASNHLEPVHLDTQKAETPVQTDSLIKENSKQINSLEKNEIQSNNKTHSTRFQRCATTNNKANDWKRQQAEKKRSAWFQGAQEDYGSMTRHERGIKNIIEGIHLPSRTSSEDVSYVIEILSPKDFHRWLKDGVEIGDLIRINKIFKNEA